jgi:hypothetical protein
MGMNRNMQAHYALYVGFVFAIVGSLSVDVVNAQLWSRNATENRCVGNYGVVYQTTSMNARQCSMAVTQNAPSANAFTYYPENGTCVGHQVTTLIVLASVGFADPNGSTCLLYTTTSNVSGSLYVWISYGLAACRIYE